MTMSRGNFAALIAPGLNKIIQTSYQEYPPEYTAIFNVSTSKRKYEDDVTISGMGLAPIKNEGESADFDDFVQGYSTRYTHDTYKFGMRFTEELIEDDLYNIANGQAGQGSKILGFAFRQSKEIAAANIFNNAFNDVAAYQGGDTETLIASAGGGGSATHPLKKSGGTTTNGPAAAVDLSASALQAAIENMELTLDDAGLTTFRKPQILLVPTTGQWIAGELLKSEYKPYTNDNEINTLQSKGLQFVVNHYISSGNGVWFLLADKNNHSLRCFQRTPFETRWFDEPKTGDVLCRGRERYKFGWSDFRGIYGSPGV